MVAKMKRSGISRWIAIAGWSLITLVFLAYFLTVLQLDIAQMLVPCQGSDCNFLALSTAEITALTSWGMSIHAYAYFMSASTVLLTLIYWILGGLIVWRQGGTSVGLSVSLALIIIPISTYGGSTDWATNYPNLAIPGIFLNIFGTFVELIFFYLIPNGKFSPRWAYIPLIITVFFVTVLILIRNGVVQVSGSGESLIGTILVGTVLLAGSFQIYRYRRESTPLERQQTKWILFGVLTYVMSVVLWVLVFGGAVQLPAGKPRLIAVMLGWFAGNNIFGLGLPVAITIAISRYRLWDIDIIIRKTLQYALMTGLLALVYFGSVILLQSLAENLFGEQSPLVIVLSTLTIAALFNPLRIRIQDFIDRRFFRKKYDAQQALAQFAATARDEVDMDIFSAALLGVVEETLQPEKVSLWLKESHRMNLYE
jgi:hypothetical protein